MQHQSLAVFNYAKQKVADLYDNRIEAPGQAYGIEVTRELNGTRKLKFSLPYMIGKENNWRWDHMKAEYKIRYRKDGQDDDWFVITSPKFSKNERSISGDIECVHESMILKSKNLYLVFDENNGIGTAPYLMEQILAGTGWHFDEDGSDVFYENYATDDSSDKVVKVRSLQSDNKTGAYELIANVCDLFNAYPVYHADSKTVTLHDLNNKDGFWEMTMGRNLTAISVEHDSDSIVTRLYVEGEYTDDGEYVGIDDVNPTGLNYLFDFSYYKSIGAFTDEHQAALDTYLERVKDVKDRTTSTTTGLMEKQTHLSNLIGSASYVLWRVQNGILSSPIVGGDAGENDKLFYVGDKVYRFYANKTYDMITLNASQAGNITNALNGASYIAKFTSVIGGSIAAKEIAIESKQGTIDQLVAENERETTSDERKQKNNETIASLQASIEGVYRGNSDPSGYETFEYLVKADGNIVLNNHEPEDVSIERSSPAAVASVSHKVMEAVVSSDESVTVPYNKTYLRFGDFGVTDELIPGQSARALDHVTLRGVADSLLDVNTAKRTIGLTATNTSGHSDNIVRLSGTSFTISVKAQAYGLYEQFDMAVKLMVDVNTLSETLRAEQVEQNNIEADFVLAMGDLLKDGYWNNDNYIVGQEQFLYNDAMDVMKEICKPKVKYTVSLIRLSQEMGMLPDEMKLNRWIRLYDPDLEINDLVYVNKITEYVDDLSKSSVDITNEDVIITGSSFSSIFSRITNIANLLEQKRSIYDRAESFKSDGSLPMQRLEGAIDLATTRILSTTSNWYTDASGNIVFEAADGTYAMMLSGAGFMIANGKKDNGDWNWRTFGTGEGFTADALITGYLSADRIEARSITANHLASDVGASLDLSSNESIKLIVGDVVSDSITTLHIESDSGFFLYDNGDTITLNAVVTVGGNIKTSTIDDAAFNWYRKSENATSDAAWAASHAGMKSIQVANADVQSGATFECRVLIGEKTYVDSVNISSISENVPTRIYLESNYAGIQTYNPNVDGNYAPDWSVSPLKVKPSVYINDIKTTLADDNNLRIAWKRRINGVESNLAANETVNASTGELTVSANVLASISSKSITYVCRATYSNIMVAQEQVSMTLVEFSELSRSVDIVGGNIFKMTNGVPDVEHITVTAITKNVNVVKWVYLNADGSEGDTVPNSTGKTDVVVYPNSGTWVGDTLTVKVITNDPTVYDLFSFYRVANGTNGTNYYAYIRYSAYSDGTDMQENPTSNTKYIGSYAGPSSTVPDKSAFKWSLYVGANGENVTVASTVTHYIQVSGDTMGKPGDNDPGWSTTMPTVESGKYIWSRTTVTFSNEQTMKTYQVSYNGNNGVSYYTYIRYCINLEDRTEMSSLPNSDTVYIGIYTGTASTAPVTKDSYTWSKLKGDNGDPGSSVSITSTSVLYAVTSVYSRPADDASDWKSTIPQVGEGQYLWTRTYVEYSDGTHTTAYNVSYSGTDGENTSRIYLTNEFDSIAVGQDGITPYTKLLTSVAAYNGSTKTSAITIKSVTGAPEGFVVTNTGVNDDDEIGFSIEVRYGTEFEQDNGTIYITASVVNNGVEHEDTLGFKWAVVRSGKDGLNGVMFQIQTPDGTVFENGQGSAQLVASAYEGGTDLSEIGDFTWYKVGPTGDVQKAKAVTYTVLADEVVGSALYKCTLGYKGVVYNAFVSLIDKTDNYQAYISSSGGDVFYPSSGTSELVCLVYQGGKRVDRDDLTYSWTKIDKNGNAVQGFHYTTKSIQISANSIDEKATFICETIGGTQAQFTVRISDDTGIVTSDTEPTEKTNGTLWLDTSVVPPALKMWDGTDWISAVINYDDYNRVITTFNSQINQLKESISLTVSKEDYDRKMGEIETAIGQAKLTEDAFRVMFKTEKERTIDGSIQGVQNSLDQYKNTVSNYMSYGSDGVLSLGSSTSTFKTNITNEKVSFTNSGNEVAYIGANDMYITNARITQTLSIGSSNTSDGWFDWEVTPTGMGLKFRTRT